jgi:hypothetical protein
MPLTMLVKIEAMVDEHLQIRECLPYKPTYLTEVSRPHRVIGLSLASLQDDAQPREIYPLSLTDLRKPRSRARPPCGFVQA